MPSSSVSGSVTYMTSDFISCGPTSAMSAKPSTFTTTYTLTLPAACPTSAWTATYTIVETCVGDPGTWTAPAVPSGFVTTQVVCSVCATPTMTITCPNVAANTGSASVMGGNGVTATMPTATGGLQMAGTTMMSTTPMASGTGMPKTTSTGTVTAGADALSLRKGMVLALGVGAAAIGALLA